MLGFLGLTMLAVPNGLATSDSLEMCLYQWADQDEAFLDLVRQMLNVQQH